MTAKIIPRTNWTTREVAKLREWFPVRSWAEIASEFAPHTVGSISHMAYRLKLKRPRRGRGWSAMAAAHRPVVLGVTVR